MPRRNPNLEHDVAGTELYVRLASGLVEIGPAVLPGSSARFHKGCAAQAPAVALCRYFHATSPVGPRSGQRSPSDRNPYGSTNQARGRARS